MRQGEGTQCSAWDYYITPIYGGCPPGSVVPDEGFEVTEDAPEGGQGGGPGVDGSPTIPLRPCLGTGDDVSSDGNCYEPLIPVEEDCASSDEDFNAYFSNLSPFEVDLSNVREKCEDAIDLSQVEANKYFMCIYKKITNSSKFRDLIIDTFGESENLNIRFEIVDDITPIPPSTNAPSATTKIDSASVNPLTGSLTRFYSTITINNSKMSSHSSISTAKTIIHEMFHAYLKVKLYGCNQGSQFEDYDDFELSEILNQYFLTACPSQSDHEFMFEEMIPTMSEILADLKDDLIREDVRLYAEENYTIFDEINPGQSLPWDWNQFYKYFSMAGLQNSNAFINNIQNHSEKFNNFSSIADTGQNTFTKHCEE